MELMARPPLTLAIVGYADRLCITPPDAPSHGNRAGRRYAVLLCD